ncbi:MAG: M23 family metallopeptidase [Clostridia bacterium]|nr:M23 family metallopeptidase [Clostridia bacterium]
MKYESDKKKNGNGIYIIIAVCAITIGIVGYLAVANNGAKKGNLNENSEKSNVFSSGESSYNKIEEKTVSDADTSEKEKTKITENTVSKVPYKAKVTKKQTFVMPIKGNIIKGYSDKTLQYDNTYGDLRMHKGIDISCEDNSKIVSASNGTVTSVEDSSDFGKTVTINHGNGLVAKYCGLGSVCVTKGEKIGVGILIGTSKNPPCECMDESHIHIECTKNGKDISPVSAFGFSK